jgi:hypothetical protein
MHQNAAEVGGVVTQVISHFMGARESCKYKFRLQFVWISATKQLSPLDKIFPTQDANHVLKFNQNMESFFEGLSSSRGVNVTILDVFNASDGAMTSDGYHNLSEYNLLIAMSVLNVLKLLLE